MKDFFDVWVLSKSHDFEAERLRSAIAATFKRRGTEIPIDPPDALTSAFAEDVAKQVQWRAFIRDLDNEPPDLATVVQDLRIFLMPQATGARALVG